MLLMKKKFFGAHEEDRVVVSELMRMRGIGRGRARVHGFV